MEPDERVGKVVAGRYQTERVIGRGGMATVYAAVDSKSGRQVALKVLRRELSRDTTVRKRFDREIQAASRLKHPNIIELFDHGTDDDDAYIVMELAPGRDLLKALAAERPMGQLRAVRILIQVCTALDVAHQAGIIHRDLKPENVVLAADDAIPGGERAKVLDFGIAKLLQPQDGQKPSSGDDPPSYVTKTALTRLGTIVGTPAYMSPEQCRAGEIDGRSDLYAAGVLLYQLVTGELPFTGETPLHTAMRHIHAPPRAPRELRSELHPDLEKVVLKALAKWPGERQQSAVELRNELSKVEALLETAPPEDRPAANMSAAQDEAPVPMAPTKMLVGGPLGKTPLGAVRLGGPTEVVPETNAPQTRPDSEVVPTAVPQTTEPSASAPVTDPVPSSDEDEPRTFLMSPEAAEAARAANPLPPAAVSGRKPTAPEVRTEQLRAANPRALARTLPASHQQQLSVANLVARPAKTMQSESVKPPRPGRPTETGLTPTMQRPKPADDDDDDDVSTFIREPGPPSVHHGGPQKSDSPSAAVAGAPEMNPAWAAQNTDSQSRDALRAMKATSRLAPEQAASMLSAAERGVPVAMQGTMRMAHEGAPGFAPTHTPAAAQRPEGTLPSSGLAPPPSSNALQALPASEWNDATSLTRRPGPSSTNASRDPRNMNDAGVVGQLAAMPGTTGFLIGIGLGLGIAAGVIVALLVMR